MSKKKLFLVLGMILFLTFLGILAWVSMRSDDGHKIILRSPDQKDTYLAVDFAVTPYEQERGLMGRTTIDRGMLFIFPEERPLIFWMKNTLLPLDIAFFDQNGMLVSLTNMTPCEADPCATYPSGGPAKYALETELGMLQKLGVQGGWKLILSEGQK